jgi:hypothetical protein
MGKAHGQDGIDRGTLSPGSDGIVQAKFFPYLPARELRAPFHL